MREISAHLGSASPTAATDRLDALERKGYIRRPTATATARNIRIREELSPHAIPVVSEVPESGPLLSPDNIDTVLQLHSSFGPSERAFSVRMPDNGMERAGIRKGDYVVADREANVKDEDVAVVLVGGHLTVRKVFSGKGTLHLAAESPHFGDVSVGRGGRTRPLARATGLIRVL